MKIYSENEYYKLYQGSMLDMLEVIEPNTIGSIVTDPPYGLTSITKRFGKENSAECQYGKDGSFQRLSRGFMGKEWDGSGIEYNIDTWKKCYEVLKPGGYLLAFGGSRTFHRIACAIEDAGFEIRDTIMWLYGSGFPKSMNIGLAIDKKNGVDNRTGNILKGVGSNNTNSMKNGLGKSQELFGTPPMTNNNVYGDYSMIQPKNYSSTGRFPANTILTYNETDFDEVCGGFPDTKSSPRTPTIGGAGGIGQATNFQRGSETSFYKDSGSASRYFYCAKASKKDRDEGLERFENKTKVFNGKSSSSSSNMKDIEKRFTTIAKNTHPTVKPTELMQYLIRLVTPPNETVLDPFNGSGSTGKAVMYENLEKNKNYKYIGIELTEEYLPISKARIEYVCNLIEENEKKDRQMTMFDII